MKVATTKTLRLPSGDSDGHELIIRYDNRGDPYQEGVGIELLISEYETISSVFLEGREAIELRDLLIALYPIKEAKR